MSERVFIDSGDGSHELKGYVPGSFRVHIDQEVIAAAAERIAKAVRSKPPVEQGLIRGELYTFRRNRFPQPDVLEGRSELTVAEVLA